MLFHESPLDLVGKKRPAFGKLHEHSLQFRLLERPGQVQISERLLTTGPDLGLIHVSAPRKDGFNPRESGKIGCSSRRRVEWEYLLLLVFCYRQGLCGEQQGCAVGRCALRPSLAGPAHDPAASRCRVRHVSSVVWRRMSAVSAALMRFGSMPVFSFVTSSINTGPGRRRPRARAERCIRAPLRMDEVLQHHRPPLEQQACPFTVS
jgi:hypothetical protein